METDNLRRMEYKVRYIGDLSSIDMDDDNIDVYVDFIDGSIYTASLFTTNNILSLLEKHRNSGENAGGIYLYCSDMIIVQDLRYETVLMCISDLIRVGGFIHAFTLVEPDMIDLQ